MALQNSFAVIVALIIEKLGTDPDLAALCLSIWGKDLTVNDLFVTSDRVNIDQTPLIMVTRPKVDNRQHTSSQTVADIAHLVRLHCYIRKSDAKRHPVSHLQDMIRFDETIDTVLMKNHTWGDKFVITKVGPSINDEGATPPMLYMTKDVTIEQRINPNSR